MRMTDAKDYVSDTQEHEEELIAREFQATTITGTILGIDYTDNDVRRMKNLIQKEVKELKLLQNHNTFAPLQRH